MVLTILPATYLHSTADTISYQIMQNTQQLKATVWEAGSNDTDTYSYASCTNVCSYTWSTGWWSSSASNIRRQCRHLRSTSTSTPVYLGRSVTELTQCHHLSSVVPATLSQHNWSCLCQWPVHLDCLGESSSGHLARHSSRYAVPTVQNSLSKTALKALLWQYSNPCSKFSLGLIWPSVPLKLQS